ncbi:hypothetical protein K0M31_012668 [Melipona bicolor]|uniref:Uncharacterized protein n=1 Tax=Melipona bicolor TaxID=60889 RepID=A0AA40FJK6_9HYME|nr:hypothetical protein K0M31_012668 [Melipona bicolor]
MLEGLAVQLKEIGEFEAWSNSSILGFDGDCGSTRVNDRIRTLQTHRGNRVRNVTKRVRDPVVLPQRLRYYVIFLQEALRGQRRSGQLNG